MQSQTTTIPTPEEIRRACAKIRKRWSEGEHVRRQLIARIKQRQLVEQAAGVPTRLAS